MKIELSGQSEFIIERLESAGYEACVVGGSLRDLLMGRPSHDTDIATSAAPERVKEVFAGLPVIETGLKHGTVTLKLKESLFEITTFRTESGYSDGRRPDKVFFGSSLTEDLARRDFTVNAMAYSPKRGFCDPFGGRADLSAGVLRAVGDPAERFTEDALRIMRGFRFAAVLGFKIEYKTKNAMLDLSPLLGRISAERKLSELVRAAEGEYFFKTLKQLFPVIKAAVPEAVAPPENAEHLTDAEARIASLFASPSEANAALLRLKASNRLRRAVTMLLKSPPVPFDKPGIKRFLREGFNTDCARFREELYGEIGSVDRVKAVFESSEAYSLKMLAVNGADLIPLGFAGGKLGDALEKLLELVITEKIENSKPALLEHAEKIRELYNIIQ